MADKKPQEEPKKTDAEVEGEEGAVAPKSKKKLIIIGVVGLLVLIGAITGLILSGVFGGGEEKTASKDSKDGGHDKKEAEKKPQLDKDGNPIIEKPIFYTMPDLIVNLNSSSPRPHFVNLKLTLEVSSQLNVAEVEAQLPRIVDSFNTYLREVRKEDLQGSAGLYRLENELQLRLNKILGEGVVTDILFKEIIVQ